MMIVRPSQDFSEINDKDLEREYLARQRRHIDSGPEHSEDHSRLWEALTYLSRQLRRLENIVDSEE